MQRDNFLLLLLVTVIFLVVVVFFVFPGNFYNLLKKGEDVNIAQTYDQLTDSEKALVDSISSINPEKTKFNKNELSALFKQKKYEEILAKLSTACSVSVDDDSIYHVQGAYRQFYLYLKQQKPSLARNIQEEQSLREKSVGKEFKFVYTNYCIIEKL